MSKNKVRPTKRQQATFDALAGARSLMEAMQKGGYSANTSKAPKQKLLDSEGFRVLLDQHREELLSIGISTRLLAELKKVGLFDKDAKVRLEYIREVEKNFGIFQPDTKESNILIGIGFDKKKYEW